MTQPASEPDRPAGWRLVAPGLAWLAGDALHLRQATLPSSTAWIAALAVGFLALAIGWRLRRLFPLAVLGVAALAWGSAGWRAEARWHDELAPALEGQDLLLTGLVASLPQRTPSGLRFRFDVESATRGGEPVRLPTHLLLGWYKGFDDETAAAQPRAELRAGQRWRLAARLRRPHGTLNPYGFDYELYLFEQDLRATGAVRDVPPPQLLDRTAGFPVERLRQRVRDGIEASVADPHLAGVLAALAVGDQGAIVVAVNKVVSCSPGERPTSPAVV